MAFQKHALGAEQQQKKEEEGCKSVKERERWAYRQQVYICMYVYCPQKAVLSITQKMKKTIWFQKSF